MTPHPALRRIDVVSRWFALLAAIWFTPWIALRAQTVAEWQPRILWGGRCVAVTTHPTNDSVAVVASESGGLWRTFDFGAHWSHVNSLPMFRIIDVKYLPDGRTLIATGWADTHATNAGGIWRSTDDGLTWSQPPSAAPACTPRWHAHGIAVDPGNGYVYVGTSCGVAVSTNNGADWTHTAIPGRDGRIIAIAAHGNGIVDIAGPDGHRRSTNNAAAFGPVSTNLPSVEWVHGLAASPLEPGTVFMTAGVPSPCPNQGASALFAGIPDSSGGVAWTALTTNVCRGGGRASWVAVSAVPGSNNRRSQIYFGTGLVVYRQSYTPGTGVPVLSRNGWMTLSVDHSDQNGMAISPQSNLPLWIVSDGGVHQPVDFSSLVAILFGVPQDRILPLIGTTWRIAGNATNGFNALQLYEITGQLGVGGATSLYTGTQDNGIPASADGGVSWPYNGSAEGYHIQLDRYGPRTTNDAVTFVYPLTPNWITGRYFTNAAVWPNPPNDSTNGVSSNPTLIGRDAYVQYTSPNSTNPVFILNLTTNRGATWITNLVTLTTPPIGWPRVSRSGSNVVLYQAINRGGGFGAGMNIGLVRITGLRQDGTVGSMRVEPADNGLGRIGIFSNGEGSFVWPEVYAVDPNDPNHLMAADSLAQQVMVSTNGGAAWFPDAPLTNLILNRDPATGVAEFSFGIPVWVDRFSAPGTGMQVHAIAFDPALRNHILVGTEASGVIRSTDGGLTWERVPGSRQINGINSFFFRENSYHDPMNTAFVSTYGRGLWKLRFPVGKRCPFNFCQRFDPWTGKWIRDPVTGDLVDIDIWTNPDFCPICQWIAVAGGSVRGFRLDQDKRLSTLAIDAGRVVGSTIDGVPLALDTFSIEAGSKSGVFEGCPACDAIVKQGGVIKGLVLEDRTVKAIIAGFGELPLEETIAAFDPLPAELPKLPEEPPATEPQIHLITSLPGHHPPAASIGSEVTVVGRRFCGKASCPRVTITIDGIVAADDVEIDASGGFQFTFRLEGSLGARVITATQAVDPKNPYTHATLLIVPVVDAEEPGLEVELIRPACVNTPDVVIAGQARGEAEGSARIERISFTVNGGPETVVCKGCGENPVFAFSAPLPIDCGENTVIVTVVEEGTGKVATRRRVVRRDSKPPEIACPKSVVAKCQDPNGAKVSFNLPVQDGCSPNPIVVYNPPSGSHFPVGTTEVRCTAIDDCGNESTCVFPVVVECAAADKTPPKIACPPDLTVACTQPLGTPVEFKVTASDDTDPAPRVECFPPSGSPFPTGSTVVRCIAIDTAGNQSECQFTVTVIDDPVPPKIVCPADIVVACAEPQGAIVEFKIGATSTCHGIQLIEATPKSGSLFPLGETVVQCVAVDTAGNKATCSFTVRVAPATVRIDANYVIRWDCGTLESAPSLNGPWEPVKGAANGTYPATPGDSRRFFRSKR